MELSQSKAYLFFFFLFLFDDASFAKKDPGFTYLLLIYIKIKCFMKHNAKQVIKHLIMTIHIATSWIN